MLLELRDVTVCYDRITAVREANLQLNAGEIVSVLGANGAGKSSLMGAAAGLLPVKSGAIFYQGQNVTGWDTHRMVRSGVCLVPEGRHVVGNMSVEENLLLGTVKSSQNALLEEVYCLLPVLRERRRQQAGLLSGGEQQMLAIARALMSEPRLMLIDEPTLGLAPKMAQQVLQLIRSLRDQGKTILLVEQNVRQALKIADRVYRMEKGLLTEAEEEKMHKIRQDYFAVFEKRKGLERKELTNILHKCII